VRYGVAFTTGSFYPGTPDAQQATSSLDLHRRHILVKNHFDWEFLSVTVFHSIVPLPGDF
jgi:hypothetical protein